MEETCVHSTSGSRVRAWTLRFFLDSLYSVAAHHSGFWWALDAGSSRLPWTSSGPSFLLEACTYGKRLGEKRRAQASFAPAPFTACVQRVPLSHLSASAWSCSSCWIIILFGVLSQRWISHLCDHGPALMIFYFHNSQYAFFSNVFSRTVHTFLCFFGSLNSQTY